MQFQNRPDNSCRMSVMACMETGNIDAARSVLTEIAAEDTKLAQDIAMDVLAAYGIVLL